jgi:hypothetical protein
MVDLDKVRAQFLSLGFIELTQENTPASLLWSPDLVFSKDGKTYRVLIKSNDSIPPAYLTRIAQSSKEKVINLIIFSQRASLTQERTILSLGVSLGYFIRGKLCDLNIKEQLPKAEIRKEIKKKKLPTIDIFLSSKQDISERPFVAQRIEVLRKTMYYPFNPPHLIEYDKFPLHEIYDHINETLDNCEWIVIVLEDAHSIYVRHEIYRAIDRMEHENIFMFVKQTSVCKTAWKKELNKIEKLKSESIKYMPYLDQIDLEVTLTKAVNKRMNEICKKEGVQIFVQ